MKAVIRDNKWIWFDHITVPEEEILWQQFSVSRPNVYVDPDQRGAWDGVYRKYNRAKKRMARPLLSMLRGVCKEYDLPLSIKDMREKWHYEVTKPDNIGYDFLPDITLDEHQLQAIRRACQIEVGIIDIPTGGGKGEIICGICKAIECPTLILSDQTIVIEQLKARLELREIADAIGVFYAGRRPNGEQIVVGSIQSLIPPSNPPNKPSRDKKKEPYSQIEKAWELLCDGCIKKCVSIQKFPDRLDGLCSDCRKLVRANSQYLDRMCRWFGQCGGWRTRYKNAKSLQQYVKTAEMLLVDECVREDSWIPTNVGLMRAGRLYDNLCNGNRIAARVNDKYYDITGWSEKIGKSVKILTNAGTELYTSDNHLCALFVDGQRVDRYSKLLKNGDMLLTCKPNVGHIIVDRRWYHFGLFVGDGHFLSHDTIRFAVRKDVSDWQNIACEMASLWSGKLSMRFNKRSDFIFTIKSIQLCDWLREFGFDVGRKMGNIKPDFIVPNYNAAAGILRGLFDAEGSSYLSSVKFDSSDFELIRFAKYLCHYLGIGSSQFISNKRTNSKHAMLWRLSISGCNAVKWRRLVGFGFMNKKCREFISSNIDSERYIDPRPWIAHWRQSLSATKLSNTINAGFEYMIPNCNNKISLSRLINWQICINNLVASEPIDYRTAKQLFGVVDSKIAREFNIDIKTSWNRRKKGNDDLWKTVVLSIKTQLLSKTVDVNLINHSVEIVDFVGESDNCRLLDFTVPGPKSFEANGILVHNCDKGTSDQWKKLFRLWFTGRRRYGFSGTPFDKDKPVERLVLQEHLGSPIIKTTREHLEDIGRIIESEYYMLAFGLNGSIHEGSAYDIAYDEWMVNNKQFHNLNAMICKQELIKNPSYGLLILVNREALGENLVKSLNMHGVRSHFIYGKTAKRKRNETLRSFEKREFNVLIGGKIIDRGLDLKGGCERLIIATGGKLQSDLLQKIGRALRHNQIEKSKIYDFFIRSNRYLYKHSKDRLKTVCDETKYQTFVVFPGGKVDGREFIKSQFQIKKKLLIR